MENRLLESIILKYFYNIRNLEFAQKELKEVQGGLNPGSVRKGFVSVKTLEDNLYKDVKIGKLENEIEYLNSAILRGNEQIIEFLKTVKGRVAEIAGINGRFYRLTLEGNENKLKIYSQPVANY